METSPPEIFHRPQHRLPLLLSAALIGCAVTQSNAATLVTGDFTADNNLAPQASQITASTGVSAAGANLTADGGFNHDNSNGFDLTAVVNNNLNTDNRLGYSFDFTTSSALSVTGADVGLRAASVDNPTHPAIQFGTSTGSDRTWDDVSLVITDSLSNVLGTLSIDLSSQADYDFAGGALPISLTGTAFNLAPSLTYTARFSAFAPDNSGVFFGTDTFSINGDVVPEPSTTVLLGLSLAGLFAHRRRC